MSVRLIKYISPQEILTNVEAPDKWVVMEKMLDAIAASAHFKEQPGISREQAWEALLEREKKQPTGISDGLAFPHCRIPDYRGLDFSLALLKQPLDFGAIDGKPAQIVCMMLTPENQPALALRLFSKMAEILTDEAIRKFFMTAPDGDTIYRYLSDRDFRIQSSVTARDILRTRLLDIRPDTPLRDVVHMMMRHQVETAAVLDKDGSIVGQITCDALFQYGMPDFFNQLQSVSFISDFDPFEKYFADEMTASAKDVMSKDFIALPPEATMLEIAFALTVQKQAKVYIVKDSKCIGVIDRAAVLDRILNF